MTTSDEYVVQLKGVGKMYKVFPTRTAAMLDALGLARFLGKRRAVPREFWALRGIDLSLKRGQRIGIIGRNGAGKSTLLKLLTSNYVPTEGTIQIKGKVHALLDAGGGFHPEFTGLENIDSALTYRGLSPREITAATQEILEFTELEDFIEQPLKTYSLGMQARLIFAVATTVKPDILIVDEMLGAGDAYFIAKSRDRVQRLVDGGATVLLVSHALDQITKICDQAIWIDRGKIVTRGPSMEVVRAYEEYMRDLEDRKLRSKHRHQGGTQAADVLVADIRIPVGMNWWCDVADVALISNDESRWQVLVGDAQDSDVSHSASVAMDDGCGWSSPHQDEQRMYRRISPPELSTADRAHGFGSVVFQLLEFGAESHYKLEITYRTNSPTALELEIRKNGVTHQMQALPPTSGEWKQHRLDLGLLAAGALETSAADDQSQPIESASAESNGTTAESDGLIIRRWPGERSLTIESVELIGERGRPRAVYIAGTPMTVQIDIRAQRTGEFEFIPAVTLFRADGVRVSNHACTPHQQITMQAGEIRTVRLNFDSLKLGDGYYLISVSLFKTEITEEERYDLVDRSFQFQVVGNEELHRHSVCRLAGEWTILNNSVKELRKAV